MHYYLQAHTEGMTKNAHEYLITPSSSFYKDESPLCSLDGYHWANNLFNLWLASPRLCNHDRHQLQITVEKPFHYQEGGLFNMSSGMRTHIHKHNYGHKFPLKSSTGTWDEERGRDWEAVGVGESCHFNSLVEAEYEESICTTHPLLPPLIYWR